jgi:ribulose-phosphate 3-epimerase
LPLQKREGDPEGICSLIIYKYIIMSRQTVEIIPALMPKDFSELEQYAEQLNGLVSTVQIDVMDGIFVPETSWPYESAGAEDASASSAPAPCTTFKEIVGQDRKFPKADTLAYELDLMIDTPEKGIKAWTQTGATRLIFHIESVKDHDWFWKQLAHVKSPAPQFGVFGVEIGLAFNIETPNEQIIPHVEKLDFVQFMGIEKIGFQGQSFDERVLPKIEDLRKSFPELIISVDGGVSMETAPRLIDAGVNRLVSGSAILKSDDIKKTIKEFQSL